MEDVPYNLDGYLITIDTDEIDADYMDFRFEKYRKALFGDIFREGGLRF